MRLRSILIQLKAKALPKTCTHYARRDHSTYACTRVDVPVHYARPSGIYDQNILWVRHLATRDGDSNGLATRYTNPTLTFENVASLPCSIPIALFPMPGSGVTILSSTDWMPGPGLFANSSDHRHQMHQLNEEKNRRYAFFTFSIYRWFVLVFFSAVIFIDAMAITSSDWWAGRRNCVVTWQTRPSENGTSKIRGTQTHTRLTTHTGMKFQPYRF